MEPKLIWANFASSDLNRTHTFYTALGFKTNGIYSDSDGASFMFGQNNFIINFFTEERLKKDVNGNVTLPISTNEIIFSLSATDREEVDSWAEKVKLAGGIIISGPQNYEEGYTFCFADPDGHKFNVLYWPGM